VVFGTGKESLTIDSSNMTWHAITNPIAKAKGGGKTKNGKHFSDQ
jgi:hypothetical protein